MRLIGRIQGEKEAFTFQTFLESKGIESTYHPSEERNEFTIWIYNEDDFEAAKEGLNSFKENPADPQFKVIRKQEADPSALSSYYEPIKKTVPELIRPRRIVSKSNFTRLIILICVALFFWNQIQLRVLEKQKSGASFLYFTPLFLKLSYDIPKNVSILLKYFQDHPIENQKELEKMPEEIGKVYKEIEEMGIYGAALGWPKTKDRLKALDFGQIRKGEVWRLFTPCLLHGGLLHILFNMLWLWLLGKQLEERIKLWQYLSITLIIGIVSNTAQYLMSGPFFIGYSGVICGLAGFIWMRQKQAPWEGYPLYKGTIAFLAIFIFGMLAIQIVSFILMRFHIANFEINLANTAHIVGALTGVLLGRIPLFSKGTL